MAKKEQEIKTEAAALLLESLAQTDEAHSRAIYGWSGRSYLQFKDHLERYREELETYRKIVKRRDRRIRIK